MSKRTDVSRARGGDPFSNMGGAPPAAVNAVMDLMETPWLNRPSLYRRQKLNPHRSFCASSAPAYTKVVYPSFLRVETEPARSDGNLGQRAIRQRGEHALENFSLQAAVPKAMR